MATMIQENPHLLNSILTSKQPSWYLNLSTWCMKNILFEQKKN